MIVINKRFINQKECHYHLYKSVIFYEVLSCFRSIFFFTIPNSNELK